MIDPHSTANAEDLFSFITKDFREPLNDVCALRIILQQPSCLWKEFNVKNLNFYADSNSSSGLDVTALRRKINLLADIPLENNDVNKCGEMSSQDSVDNDTASQGIEEERQSPQMVDHLTEKMREMICLPLFQRGFVPVETLVANSEKGGFVETTGLMHPL